MQKIIKMVSNFMMFRRTRSICFSIFSILDFFYKVPNRDTKASAEFTDASALGKTVPNQHPIPEEDTRYFF